MEMELFEPYHIGTKFVFLITPEVRDKMKGNEHLQEVIDSVLVEISNLPELSIGNCLISVSLERDIELSDWEEILVSVQVEERSFVEKMKLWEAIEQKVRGKIEDIRGQCDTDEEKRVIDEINQDLAIEVVERAF